MFFIQSKSFIKNSISNYLISSCFSVLSFLPVIIYSNQSLADIIDDYSWSAHLKYQVRSNYYPEQSLYRDLIDTTSFDQLADLRWKFSANKENFDFKIDYQLQVLEGDLLEYSQQSNSMASLSSASIFSAQNYSSDERRVFDLTRVMSDDEDTVILHRLDRFNIGYSQDNTVVRIGRQVVSWGNGLIYNPLDFFNPFDPVALDKEYKTGDDMVYGQYLLNSGSDFQAVWVARRKIKGDGINPEQGRGGVSSSQQSVAVKYHYVNFGNTDNLFSGMEMEFVLAQHYENNIAGVGAVKSVGGALWRSDLMVTKTERQRAISFVTNFSYSWVWGDRNYSGIVEYFYNGFGLKGNNASLEDLTPKNEDDKVIDLLEKIQRGELYGIGRHYLAASATVELTPLAVASPSLYINLVDHSALLQLSVNYDIAQNWQVITALNFPLGPKNTEFGGMKTNLGLFNSDLADTTLATDASLFVQFAFYF